VDVDPNRWLTNLGAAATNTPAQYFQIGPADPKTGVGKTGTVVTSQVPDIPQGPWNPTQTKSAPTKANPNATVTTPTPNFQGGIFGPTSNSQAPSQTMPVNPIIPANAPGAPGVAPFATPPAFAGIGAPTAPGGGMMGGGPPLHSFLTPDERNIISSVAMSGGPGGGGGPPGGGAMPGGGRKV
jgi:hypothetical protein